jgi:asparagine synthase (glutamine-hydrolysing)
LGIKPLYYSIHGGRLIFGSELKAVLADPDVPREIDPQGLVAYLQYGYVPDPLTILKTVRKLPPGHLLIVRRGQVEIKAYWDVLSFFASSQEPKSEDNCEVELGNYLWEAVRLRLISDVPVGAFLSGGVDSSMVVALMARSLDHPVKTFSIGFKEEAFNELPYAREVAQHLGTDHHELMLDPERVDVIEKIVWHFDEPFGDPSALPTYFVSKLARESVKVILSGDGGDELFGGYDRYVEHLRRGFADHIPSPIKLWMLKPLSRVLREGVPGKRFLYNLSLPPLERYLDSVSHFPPRLLRGLLSPDVLTELTGNGDSDSTKPIMSLQTAEMLSQIQAVDFKTYLPGDILVKVDRMSMAHSVEARVPLLDHKLVEYAVGLPASMKVRAEVSKYLFKRIARRFLPDSIINRKKQGFGVPLQKWFKEDLKAFLWDILGDPTARGRSYFVRNGPISLLKHQRRESESTRLWMLAMLELWHRVVLDR